MYCAVTETASCLMIQQCFLCIAGIRFFQSELVVGYLTTVHQMHKLFNVEWYPVLVMSDEAGGIGEKLARYILR